MRDNDPSLTAMRTADALARGVTRGQMRGPLYESVGHGLVKPAGLEEDPIWSRISIATGLMTTECVLGGWAAIRAQGHSWFSGTRFGTDLPTLVHCEPHSRIRRRDGVEPFRGLLHPDEVIRLERYAVTTVARALFDEMRMAPNIREAVVALDLGTSTTMQMPHTTRAAVERVIASHHKVRGLVKIRKAFSLGSTRTASPWETRTRLLAELDAGIAGLGVNIPIFDLNGQLLGITDLLDHEAGLVIESDGGDHRENQRHTDDNRREEALERVGLVVSRITSIDHADRWQSVERILAARSDALATNKREWTTNKPDWWWNWRPARRWD